MNKIQKNSNGKIANSTSDDGKIRLGGRLGVDLKVTIPGTVEGEGDAKISFKLPTWLTFDILRRIGERINPNHNGD